MDKMVKTRVKITIGSKTTGFSEEIEFNYDGTAQQFDRDDSASTYILNKLICGEFKPFYMDIETEEIEEGVQNNE